MRRLEQLHGLSALTARCAPIACALVALGASGVAAASDEGARDPGDEREMIAMRAKSPRAAELLEEGEALAKAGDLSGANLRFRRGHLEYPEGALLWRRDCETRTVLGPRRDAVLACSAAIERGHSGLAVRALVSALVDGPTLPTSTELSEALLVTARERDNPLGQATAAAAACDIAERIGDRTMLHRCTDELERLAPDDPATRTARAALDSGFPPWRFWVGWSAVASAVLVTIVHALRRHARRLLSSRSRSVAGAAVSLCLLCAPVRARADVEASDVAPHGNAPHGALSKWPIDADHPESAIPSETDRNANPLEFGYWLQDLALKGERASKSGDHAAAARYYAALGLAVPDRAVSYVKLCAEYEAMGTMDKAINACGDALLRDGALVSDYTRFVRLMLGKPGPLAPKDVAALTAVLAHLRQDPAGRDAVDDLECQVGTRTTNVAQLEECTRAMAARAPDDARTLSYQWALAVAQSRFTDARALSVRAKAAGVAPESIAAMDRAAESSETTRRERHLLIALAVGLFLSALAVAAGTLARKRRAPVVA